MYLRKNRYLTALFLVTSLIWGALSGGFVLCLGDDGRQHFAAIVDGDCASEAPVVDALPQLSFASVDPDDDCGSCLDVAVSSDRPQPRLLQPNPPAPALPDAVAATIVESPLLALTRFDRSTSPPPLARRILRSTVLRC